MKVFQIIIDDEPYETAEHKLTARQILVLAKLDPNGNYLIEVNGKNQVSYKDDPEATVNIHEKATFVTASRGATPVS